MSKITKEQIERVVIDAGKVYVNYGLPNERLLAPCRGDNTFDVEAEIREMEFNGTRGKTKGLRRKISENASLSVNLADLSLENLKMALPGSRIVDNELSNGWTIENSDYLENVVLIGVDRGGKFKKITVYNALMDEALSLAMVEDDESVIELTLSGHYDPEDTDNKLWAIKDLESLVNGDGEVDPE